MPEDCTTARWVRRYQTMWHACGVYSERPSTVPGAVVWTNVVTPGESRILPDGCIDIIWNDGSLFVAGPDTTAHLFSGVAGSSITGLRFAPGTAPSVLGVPAHTLVDQRPALHEVWSDRRVRSLSDRLGCAADAGIVLEHEVGALLAAARPVLGVSAEIVAGARRGCRVDEIAGALGHGMRRLHRYCLDAFGYGPKTLSRILRLNTALDMARSGVDFADAAARSGYADQAHLARDVKALAGVSLTQLIH